MSDLFVVICRDQPNSKPARAACLSKHLTHIENEIDRISFAAALKDDNDEFFGSIAIVKSNSCSDARSFIRQDPFFRGNVWANLEVHRLGPAAGFWAQNT